ncbi:MAG: tRNA dihydrouridine synthase DusB [Candidatus Omnitrophica bacterium]|nr:tRNA dihydrouridine synthase DusB [Candidatus Omnitrophota bacterium]
MKIGKLELNRPVMLAPMEDVTDMPFRVICREIGADVVFTEFTSSEAIIRNIPRAIDKIEVCEQERPVAIQIFGGVEENMMDAAAMAESLGPDFIDINCGCWVKNHVARGQGAALLKDLPHFEKIVRSTVRGTDLPVTVKTRLGWDQDSIVILDVARMIEAAGAKALTVHCRTRSQAHNKAPADWSWLEKIKRVVSIPVIGNGDITCAQDCKQMFDTGCDGVMIGRAAIGNPWIFRESRHFLETGELLPPPSLKERVDVCLRHLRLAVDHKGIHGGLKPFRKFYAGYFHGWPNAAILRRELMLLESYEAIAAHLHHFLEKDDTFHLCCP